MRAGATGFENRRYVAAFEGVELCIGRMAVAPLVARKICLHALGVPERAGHTALTVIVELSAIRRLLQMRSVQIGKLQYGLEERCSARDFRETSHAGGKFDNANNAGPADNQCIAKQAEVAPPFDKEEHNRFVWIFAVAPGKRNTLWASSGRIQ